MEINFSIILRTMLVVLLLESSKAIAIVTDFIFQNESITDEKTLASSDGSFELGFFNPGSSSSTNRYLGIWYKKIPLKTVVWVANRQKPVKGSSGALLINSTGQVMIMDENGSVVWSANQTKLAKQTSVLQLLDSGNLVLKDEIASDNYLWQSFDYPSDTLLPDMKLGWDSKTGVVRRITSWKSFDDPSLGDTSSGLEHSPYPEAIVWKGTQEFVRSGPWNGLSYSGSPELKSNSVYSISFVFNLDEAYYTYHLRNKSLISRIVAKQTNQVDRQVWIESEQKWITYLSVPKDLCDNYGLCGAYGNCIISESPVCQCLDGFKPKSAEKWNSVDWTEGCVRNKPLTCQDSDGFVEYFGLKLPDTRHTWVNKSMSLEECRVKCLENCSCMAYTNSDVRGLGSGCVMWLGDLVDIRQVPGGGENLYIRMHVLKSEAKARKKIKVVAVVLVTTIGIVGAMVMVYCYVKKSKTKTKEDEEDIREKEEGNTKPKEDLELPIFNLATIADATDNFSPNRKLGEGGFGPVYMGNLADGREIAVKRLSKSSGQGLNEFKNEVILISKLQHRNLVKLLGCCIQEEEKLLVYEYMPNKSLDFIFDQKRAELLDWSKRFNIICGIARGLLYLHQDSRLRIIHRDLKASNVLLDHEMTPKISDFGLARICGGDEIEENTKRVVGTYGYMAYAINGLFSVKSDVFSFGILVLEVISGKKNRASYDHPNHSLNIIGQAWRLWNEGRTSDFVNECLVEEFCNISDQVARCVHISLLCVQRRAEDRPKMSSVILMLESEITLPQPQRPADFYVDKESISQNNQEFSSTNELTLTLEAR